MNPNDQIRRQILQYFYDRNKHATSQRGKKGVAVKISDARRELKEQYGLKVQEVMSNLTYLIDNGWVKTVDVEKTVKVAGGTIPQVTTFYEVTARGIDKIEGGSQFEPKERYAGINIHATGQNVITLGDGNVVNAKYSELRNTLDDLKQAVTGSTKLNDSTKLDLAADIETIKDQLAKPDPDKTIVGHLWRGVERVVTVAGLADACMKVLPYIQALLP
jgi:hypothetical protein